MLQYLQIYTVDMLGDHYEVVDDSNDTTLFSGTATECVEFVKYTRSES